MIKYITGFIVIIATSIVLVFLYFYKSINYDLDKLIHYNPPLSSQIYDTKGRLVANVFDNENRLYAGYKEIPNIVIEALVATEDTAFFEHKGVSFEAIIRALVKDAIAGRAVEGASTLTQQLVKITLLTSEKKISRKIKEAIISFKLEERLTKQDILERYLNQIYFGHGYYGVKTAAFGYFHKNLSELTLKEAAILIGLPKAPSYYDPLKNPEASYMRANSIINRMHYLGWIDDKSHQRAISELPKVYNDPVMLNRAPYAVDAALKQLAEQFPDIKAGGYRVELTIDLDLQLIAENALIRQYNEIVKNYGGAKNLSSLNGAVVSMEQGTGDVLAMVGGVSYKHSPFNRVTQSKRQAGSSIKPFIYLTALNAGFTPASKFNDAPKSYSFRVGDGVKEWAPQNYDNKFEGPITMRYALAHSKNLATIDLVEQVGIGNVVDGLSKFGFDNPPRELTIALGSVTLSPFEFCKLWSGISGYGVQVEPRLVKSVRGRNAQTILFEAKKKVVAEPSRIYTLIDMLKDVVRSGTGTRAAVAGVETAGKTGTTNDYRDAWFCGFTPSVQTLVWFGNDDNKPLPGRLTGGVASAPVFAEFVRGYMRYRPDSKVAFDIPQESSADGGTEVPPSPSPPMVSPVKPDANGSGKALPSIQNNLPGGGF